MSFKARLLLGATAPFVFALPAAAQVSISTATTAPVATSNGGTPSDISIVSGGSITITSATTPTAVTIDTNNKVTNAGSINVQKSDDATGLHILSNLTAAYTGTGSIVVGDDYVRVDTDADGDLDGPVATGNNRIGILVDPGTLTGTIDLNGGSVTVQGNNSYGVSLRALLNGDYRQSGNVTVIGSNGIGVDIREDVNGNVKLGGTTAMTGEGSIGARVLGDVSGEFMVDGVILSTGFTSTTISNYADPDTLLSTDTPIADRRDADDLLVGGSALEVRGDLARGFLLQGPATGGVDPTDDIKDVVQDFNENRTAGTIASFGSAPAVVVQSLDGAAGDAIHLGKVRESVRDTLDDDKDSDVSEIIGVFNYDYGFMNRGTITANGTNIGFSALGLKIAGSADGTHATVIDGGILNAGSIATQAYEANATGFLFGSGASTPLLLNTGSISAGVATETNHDATAVLIDAGASLPQVTNNGIMLASTRGYDGDAVAFRDLSGTVTSFTNNSRVTAGHIDDDTTDTVTSGLGADIALDLSHSASGVTLTQTDTIDNARIFGDVRFGVGGDRFNLLSGEVTGDVDFGASGADIFAINSAKLTGDAAFHGASADFSMLGGTMTGDLALGTATSTLSFTNGSVFNGGITHSGASPVTVAVNNSTLNNSAAGTLNLDTMSFANNAKIGLVIDNARITGNTPIYNVAGTLDIAANTLFTPIFSQFRNQPFTLRVINAGTLNLGGPLSAMLNSNSPYLYNMALQQPNANAIDLVLSVKSPTQLGLNQRQGDAYGAVLDLLEQDDTVASAVTSIPGAAEFLRGWSDLLPGSDASVMRVLSSNATAAFGATAHRLDLISQKPDAPGGAWTEEFGVAHNRDADGTTVAVSGGGFGVAAGVDLISTGTALVGAYASLESAELEEENRTGAPLNVAQTSVGVYGGWLNGNLSVNAAASVGFVDFRSDRKIEVGTLTDRVKGSWSGMTYTAGARANYTLPLGFIDVKPYVAADYTGFTQDGYTETGATDAGLQLVAGDSDASLATASYGVSFVGNFGGDDAYSIKPELSVSYRNVLSWDNTSADYRFSGGSTGSTFKLAPGDEPEDGIVAGLGLNIDSQFLNMKIGYDAEISDNAITHYGSITLRMAFW